MISAAISHAVKALALNTPAGTDYCATAVACRCNEKAWPRPSNKISNIQYIDYLVVPS